MKVLYNKYEIKDLKILKDDVNDIKTWKIEIDLSFYDMNDEDLFPNRFVPIETKLNSEQIFADFFKVGRAIEIMIPNKIVANDELYLYDFSKLISSTDLNKLEEYIIDLYKKYGIIKSSRVYNSDYIFLEEKLNKIFPTLSELTQNQLKQLIQKGYRTKYFLPVNELVLFCYKIYELSCLHKYLSQTKKRLPKLFKLNYELEQYISNEVMLNEIPNEEIQRYLLSSVNGIFDRTMEQKGITYQLQVNDKLKINYDEYLPPKAFIQVLKTDDIKTVAIFELMNNILNGQFHHQFNICQHCGDLFFTTRKGKRFCDNTECQRDRDRIRKRDKRAIKRKKEKI